MLPFHRKKIIKNGSSCKIGKVIFQNLEIGKFEAVQMNEPIEWMDTLLQGRQARPG